jgi:hypothetical protein
MIYGYSEDSREEGTQDRNVIDPKVFNWIYTYIEGISMKINKGL